MANTVINLVDWARRQDPKTNKTAGIVELLAQTNEIIGDMPFVEGNLPTGHRITMRASMPTVYFRKLNKGVAKSKSTTTQGDFGCAILEARSEVDVDIASLDADLNGFRMSEAKPFIEAMNQEMASTVFYGTTATTTPEEINGFATIYSSTSAVNNGKNIILGGGAGNDNYSMYLVGWGEGKVYGIYPSGSQMGLIHEDLGIGDAFDSDYNRFRAYMDRWQWKFGLVVEDWRYIVRVPNVDLSDLQASGDTDLTVLMLKAQFRIPNLAACRPIWYMNRTTFQYLVLQRREAVKDGGGLTHENVDGVIRYSFNGIPVHSTDSLIAETTAIS